MEKWIESLLRWQQLVLIILVGMGLFFGVMGVSYGAISVLIDRTIETKMSYRALPTDNPAAATSPYPSPSLSPLTLERVFDDKRVACADCWDMVVTGDVMLGRDVNFLTHQQNDFGEVLAPMRPVLSLANLTLINLESLLLDECVLTRTGMRFCGSTDHVSGLAAAGVDVASLANNHGNDQGWQGREQTMERLEQFGIAPVENYGLTTTTVKRVRVAIVGVETVNAPFNERRFAELMAVASTADVVIPFFHWGVEYTHEPTREQREIGRLAMDLGADVVVGNHPHWVQAVEIYNGKLIVYSHGNLVFDQLWSQKTREGVIGHYQFDGDGLVDAWFTPIVIGPDYRPDIADVAMADEILMDMQEASEKLVILTSD